MGAEDDEHPAARLAAPALHLQRQLTDIIDRRIASALAQYLGQADWWPDVRRLRDLSDPQCHHGWLWQHSPETGPVLAPVEYVTAVRLRLGAAGPDEPAVCGYCGKQLLDASAAHALCCANSVVGHNAVRDELHAAASMSDPSAELEPLGLITSHPTLRPADVLTSAALPGRLAALDVGVASPDAAGAGDDCTQSMVASKRGTYAAHLDALGQAGIQYQPVVWSAYGRPHPDAKRILLTMARTASRRRGLESYRELANRWASRITTELWRRAARMVLACWPRHDGVPSGCEVVGTS